MLLRINWLVVVLLLFFLQFSGHQMSATCGSLAFHSRFDANSLCRLSCASVPCSSRYRSSRTACQASDAIDASSATVAQQHNRLSTIIDATMDEEKRKKIHSSFVPAPINRFFYYVSAIECIY
jgi:hypothetical protein